MDIALGIGIFVLGVVIGTLIGAAACSEGRVRVTERSESDGWLR